MLLSLSVQNFALAQALELDFASGFTVLTGETGAGKSILLDALSLCLGERGDGKSVRYGAEKADLSAEFDLRHAPAVHDWLQQRELLDDEDSVVRLRRVLLSSGRSKAWINGTPSSQNELRELGQLLVQLYSQHSQQQLLQTGFARRWLDQAAGLQPLAKTVANRFQAWHTLRLEEKKAHQAQAERENRLQLLAMQLEDVQPLAAQDYASLEQEYDRLSHFETMMQETSALLDGLDEGEDNIHQKLSSLLKRAEHQATRAPALQATAQLLATAREAMTDAVAELRQFVDQQNFDPERLQELDSLLGEFHRLARKYRINPEELQPQAIRWQEEYQQLQMLADPEALAEQVRQAEADYRADATELQKQREALAPELMQQLQAQTRPLALPEARFECQFSPLAQPTADGLSDIQLLFSANKGIPPQSLSKVASGGELSRIALVMQVMVAQHAESDVLLFDEVDVGISGGTAELVGKLLRKLGERVQVICITHQPQVAAQGHTHFLVQKHQTDPALSTIHALAEEDRILELARMSGGVDITPTTLEHARSLRQQANA